MNTFVKRRTDVPADFFAAEARGLEWLREANAVKTLTAGITVYRINADGTLAFVRKYDVDTGKGQQFWSGMVALA